MKSLYFVGGTILLISGIIHLFFPWIYGGNEDVFIYGLITGIIGFFIIKRRNIAIWLGAILPLLGIVLGGIDYFVKDIPIHFYPPLAIAELFVVILCIIILLKDSKTE